MQFEHFTADQGLSIGFISDIVRDKQGFMWFAGAEGLARFDGYDYRIYRHHVDDPEGLSSNMVWSLAVDLEGVLWIRTSEGISRFDAEQERFTHLLETQATSDLRASPFVVDHEGELWVTTLEGLMRYDRGGERFVVVKSGKGFSDVNHLVRSADGTFWLVSASQGLISWSPLEDVIEIFSHNTGVQSSMSKSQVQVLYEATDGRLLIGTLEGLSIFDPKVKLFTHYQNIEGDASSLGSNIVMDIAQDKNGNVWLATDGGGLNLFDLETGRATRYKHDGFNKESLSSNVLKTIFKDENGDLWLGMYPSGVDYFNRLTSSFASYRHHPLKKYSLSNNDAGSICEDHLGNLWLGTGGGLNYFDRKAQRFYNIHNEPKDPGTLGDSPVMKVYCDSKRRLWAAVWGVGLYRLDEGAEAFIHYPADENSSTSIPHANIWAMLEDRKGGMWFGTENGFSRFDELNNQFFSYKHDPEDSNSLTNNHVWSITQDYRGQLWIGTLGGLSQFDPVKNTFKNFDQQSDKPDSLPASTIYTVFEDSKRRLWIGSTGSLSLFDRDTETFSHYANQGTFASSIVRAILEDDEGYLWVSSPKGITRFNPDTLETQVFDKNNGLQGNEFSFGAAKTKKGELVFGGRQGFNIISDVYEVQRNSILPAVRFTSLSISNKPVKVGVPGSPLRKAINYSDAITFTPDQALVSFEFAALSYRNRHKNQYAYMLEGFDKDWYFIGKQRVATYTNLDPGVYTLKVKASNDEGVWSQNTTDLAITVLPPWYKTWWAYLLYALLVLGQILRILYSQHQKKIQAELHRAELEKKVQERTEQLRQKTQDINNMLQSMHQGIFTVDSELHIHPEYSRFLETIIGSNQIAGRSVISAIFDNCNMSEDELELIESALHSIFFAEKGLWDINKHLLVGEIVKLVEDKEKILELDWDPLLGEDGRVEKMLITVRDVTSIRDLQRAAQEHAQELGMVGQILAIPPKSFDDFYHSAKRLLGSNRQLLESDYDVDANCMNVLIRNMHTVKGNARTLGLSYLTDSAHEFENELESVKDLSQPESRSRCLNLIQKNDAALSQYYQIYDEKLVHYNQNSEVGSSRFDQIFDDILHAAEENDTGTIIELINNMQTLSFNECMEPLVAGAATTASSLNKFNPEIKIDAYGVQIMRAFAGTIRDVFTHIITNAIAHGIEANDVRAQKNKDAVGSINIVARQEDDFVVIRVWDDGQGLAIDKLRSRFEDFKSPAQTIANKIFESGISTANEVSKISGRGVGLEAVSAFLEDIDGSIKIQFTADIVDGCQPFEFVIRFPA